MPEALETSDIEMKRFLLAEMIIAVASRWWLVVIVLACIGGFLAFVKQIGSNPISWNYVVVCTMWGAGLGFLFVVSSVNKGKGAVPLLLSVMVVATVAGVTGWVLEWDSEKALIAVVGGAVLGLSARWWAPRINLG